MQKYETSPFVKQLHTDPNCPTSTDGSLGGTIAGGVFGLGFGGLIPSSGLSPLYAGLLGADSQIIPELAGQYMSLLSGNAPCPTDK